jgi:Entner-Doudoroff aldolase
MTMPFCDEFDQRLRAMPIIAILRGLPQEDAIAVCQALLDAGITVAEIPLNSPEPFETIALLRAHFGDDMAIGAGTVLNPVDIEMLAGVGCQFCVAPNTDPDVIGACLRRGMLPVPGFSTASEALAAVAAGARHIKAFPAQASTLSALKAVLPAGVRMIAVGGVTPADVPSMLAAGASAFGTGSDLYRPGRPVDAVAARAREWGDVLKRAAAPAVELVCNPEAIVGEGLVSRDGEVLWVDPATSRLLRCRQRGQWAQTPLSEPVWSLGVLPDGRLVGNGESHFVAFDSSLRNLRIGPAIDPGAGCRLNDLVIDRRGGLWGGSMHRGALANRGAIFHARSFDASARRVADGLGVANGMAFSSDERTLFVIDTLHRTLLAYPADTAAGTLGEPVIVTDFLGLSGKPDGMAIAEDHSFWVAMWGGGQVVQIAPNGAVVRQIDLPTPHVGSLCLGPSDELFVSTSRARMSDVSLAKYPGSGGLFRISLAAL